jgi:riboflavin kinase/FMN adenylyltransferase
MLNIGHRPTVNNEAERSFEVHIIGFEGDLYGRPLCIELVERLREERSFASLEELTAQLANDRETVMAIFNYNT